MNRSFWGVPVEFERFEKVIIDSAETCGYVNDIRIDSEKRDVMYYVMHKEGAVHGGKRFISGSSGIWLKPSQIRKIKPKKPMLESLREFWQSILGRLRNYLENNT